MDWITGMQKAIDYIEAHLKDEINYEDVAAECYSSSFNFQRVFGILCGYTLGEYIRNRRLSLAGAELAATDAKVIDVALDYGYDSPDSFARAFKSFHGILPSEAKRKGKKLKSFSRLVLKLSLEGGNIMNYRIEEKPEMILTGYKKRLTGIPDEREDQECDFYVHTRPQQYLLGGLTNHPETQHNVVTNVGDDGYDFWITQELTANVRARMHEDCVLGDPYANWYENIVIPAHLYAVFETERCKYPTTVFLDLKKKIVSEWLPSSGYRLADAPEIVVTHWYRHPRSKERYREIWVPIEKDE